MARCSSANNACDLGGTALALELFLNGVIPRAGRCGWGMHMVWLASPVVTGSQERVWLNVQSKAHALL